MKPCLAPDLSVRRITTSRRATIGGFHGSSGYHRLRLRICNPIDPAKFLDWRVYSFITCCWMNHRQWKSATQAWVSGINAVRTMFDMANTALALVESAHLASLKAYSIKFMAHLTQRLDAETGLRAPTMLEAQSADKQLWHIMAELISEKGWTLDQALHEMTNVRGDMAVLLQARPRLPRPSPPTKGGKGPTVSSAPQAPKGTGKKGKKGGSKSSKPGVKWVTGAYVDGVRKQLCMRFQTNSCTFSDCKFHHACAVPKSDGTACGLPHAASQHDATPH